MTGNQTHLACVNQACVVVAGGGANLCANNAQCQNSTNQTRLTCINNACTRVQGTGNNTCSPQGSVCGTTNQTHLECRSNTCSIVNGSGNSLCSPQGSACNVTGMPDLIIDAWVNEINVTGNVSIVNVTVFVTVKNIGASTAGSSTTRIKVLKYGGRINETHDMPTNQLSPGSRQTLIRWFLLERGSYSGYSKADQFLAVNESIEYNNERNVQFTV